MDSAYHLAVDFVIILILILGIWRFNAPQTARSGNLLAAFALLCALGVVLCGNVILDPATVIFALLAGGAVGALVAVRVNMIQIPAMIAFQHGAGEAVDGDAPVEAARQKVLARRRDARRVGVQPLDEVAVACVERRRQPSIGAAEVDHQAASNTRQGQDLLCSGVGRSAGRALRPCEQQERGDQGEGRTGDEAKRAQAVQCHKQPPGGLP